MINLELNENEKLQNEYNKMLEIKKYIRKELKPLEQSFQYIKKELEPLNKQLNQLEELKNLKPYDPNQLILNIKQMEVNFERLNKFLNEDF